MNHRLFLFAFLIAMCAGGTTVSAQAAPMNVTDSTVILVQAVRYFTQQIKPGTTVALNPDRVTVGPRGEVVRSAGAWVTTAIPANQIAAVRAGGARIVAVSSHADAPMTCTIQQFGQGRESRICQFRDFSHLLTLGSLHAAGDTARVFVTYSGNRTATRLLVDSTRTISGSVTLQNTSDMGTGWILLVRSGVGSWRAVAYRVLMFY